MKRSILCVGVVVLFVADARANPLPHESNLVGYWTFDGTFNDSSGRGNDGVGQGGVGFFEGKYGQAALFDGVDDYVRITDSTDFKFNTSFTIATWVQFFDNPNRHQHLFTGNQPQSEPHVETPIYALTKDRSEYLIGGLDALVYEAPDYSNAYSTMNGDQLPKHEWMHVASVADKDTGQLRLYVNGELQPSIGALIDYDYSVTPEFQALIGAWEWMADDPGNFLHGALDEMAIWDRALTSEELSEEVIPEPSTLALLLMATVGLLTYALRQRRR